MRALLINNNSHRQQFSKSCFTTVFYAYTGIYNNICHTIFYFRKLQACRTAPACGTTCGIHVLLALLTKSADISGLQYAIAHCLSGREIYTNCCQYIHLPFDTELLTRNAGCKLESDEIPNSENTHQQVRSSPLAQLYKAWLKTWKRFYSDGECPLDATWCLSPCIREKSCHMKPTNKQDFHDICMNISGTFRIMM